MSVPLRCGFTAVLVASFATPAASNPFTDLFSPNAAPEAAAAAPAAAPAQEECLLQPGKTTAAGQRWVYRHDGHRKCWFQADAGTALARKAVHRHATRPRAAAPEANESASRKDTPHEDEAVADAHAEMAGSTPAEAPQPAPPESAPKMVQTVPVPMTASAALVPPAPVLAKPGADQPAPDQPTQSPIDVAAPPTDAPAASDEVASVPPSTPVAVPSAEIDRGGGWTTPWFGVLLILLGFAALLSASRTLRRALWPERLLTPERNSRPSRPTAAAVSRSVGVRPIGQRDEVFRRQQGHNKVLVARPGFEPAFRTGSGRAAPDNRGRIGKSV